jgi:pfkB family carbohydrate kinase
VLEGDAVRRLPVFSIAAVDTVGAGDAFLGGFALALAEGQSELEAMRFGAAAAGIKCTRLGGHADALRGRDIHRPEPPTGGRAVASFQPSPANFEKQGGFDKMQGRGQAQPR